MGIYGHKFDSLLTESQFITEGRNDVNFINYLKDVGLKPDKNLKDPDYAAKNLVTYADYKKFGKAGMSAKEIVKTRDKYYKDKEDKKKAKEIEQIYSQYDENQIKTLKDIIGNIKEVYNRLYKNSKFKNGLKTDEGDKFDISLSIRDIEECLSNGIKYGHIIYAYIDIEDGDRIEYDTNVELFEMYNLFCDKVYKSLKNKNKIDYDYYDNGRSCGFIIEKKDLK